MRTRTLILVFLFPWWAAPVAAEGGSIVVRSVGGPRCQGGEVVYPPVEGEARTWSERYREDPESGVHHVIDRVGGSASVRAPDRGGAIRIALVNQGDGSDPVPEDQLVQLVLLVDELRTTHGIALSSVVGGWTTDVDAAGAPVFLSCGGRRVPRTPDLTPVLDWKDFLARLRMLAAGYSCWKTSVAATLPPGPSASKRVAGTC